MKQVQAFGPQDLRMIEVEEPKIQANEVKIQVKSCGICGSDKWFWYVPSRETSVAGHEAAGQVIETGAAVKSLKAGDRIAVNNVKGCGECASCLEGAFIRCRHGIEHMGFGFSERITVPERNCLLLDSSVSYEMGSLIFDQWGTPFAAIDRAGVKNRDAVLVTGCGPIGLAAVALAKNKGARVIACDPIKERREKAIAMGAETAFHPQDNVIEMITNFAAEGINLMLECSGQSSSYLEVGRFLAVEGRIAVIGEGATIELSSSALIHKHITISASLYSSMKDGEAIQKKFVEKALMPESLVTHYFPFEALSENFGKVIHFEEGIMKAVVVFTDKKEEAK